MRMVSTFGWGAIALAAILLVPAAASGQITYTWNQPTSGGNWQTAANWLPNSGAPTAITDIAVFGNVATGANTVTLSGSVSIGELRFDGVTAARSTAAYTIGATAQTITVNNGAGGHHRLGRHHHQPDRRGERQCGDGRAALTIINNGGSGLNTLDDLRALCRPRPRASALNVSGWSNTTISGAIGNSIGTLTKDGPGVLTLSTRRTATPAGRSSTAGRSASPTTTSSGAGRRDTQRRDACTSRRHLRGPEHHPGSERRHDHHDGGQP